jgi:8-oxo-dGTP pyrophosphatase MutT (NUDIX family)
MAEPDAAVAILHAREPEESVLLMRRSERVGDPWSGHWSFPGGRRDPEDTDPLHTALRELDEECGIRLAREHLERALTPVLARRNVPPFLLVAPFVFRVEGPLPAVLDEREAVEERWIPLRVLTDPSHHGLRAAPGMPADMLFPSIDLNGVPLWGFTYRLLTDWLGLLPDDGSLEPTGFGAARDILDFLLSRGLALEHPWVARRATVRGRIPVSEVVNHLSAPRAHIPRVNYVEVRPDRIRVGGLAFEEYTISGAY